MREQKCKNKSYPCQRKSKSSKTCKGLTKACEVEEASSGHGEQLTQKHQEGERGEDHGQDHEGLDRLQPVCKDNLKAERGTL